MLQMPMHIMARQQDGCAVLLGPQGKDFSATVRLTGY